MNTYLEQQEDRGRTGGDDGPRLTHDALNISGDVSMGGGRLHDVRSVDLQALATLSTGSRSLFADSAGNLRYRNASGDTLYVTSGSGHPVEDSSITPAKLAPLGSGFQAPLVLLTAFCSGSSADATLTTGLPEHMLLYDAFALVRSAATGSVTLRSAPAGGGVALTQALSTTNLGDARETSRAGPNFVSAGTALYANRTNLAAACDLVVIAVKF